MRSHYDVLGVAPEATPAEVARGFRSAARRAHPDMGGSADEFAEVSLAWEVLGDPTARAAYDLSLEPVDLWSAPEWGAAPPGPGRAADDRQRSDGDAGVATSEVGGDPRAEDAIAGSLDADDASLPRTRNGGLDPFRGAPVVLPPLAPPPLADFVPSPWPDRLLLACAVLAVVAAAPVAGLTTAALWSSQPNAVMGRWTPVYGALVGVAGVIAIAAAGRATLRHWREHPPDQEALRVRVYLAAALVWISATRAVVLTTEIAVLGVGALVALDARARRRATTWQVRMRERRDADLAAMELGRLRAERWNHVRAAASDPGARIVRIGKPVHGDRRHRRVRVVGSRRRTMHYFTAFAQDGWWAVLDEGGQVLALAPPDAPRRWSAVVAAS